MHNRISSNAGKFFESYAGQFDKIYMIQTQGGLRGWVSRRLRASMVLRYEKTFSALESMQNCTVLDIGCGSGRYLAKCLELGAASVTGIDLSEEMLLLSKKALDGRSVCSDKVELLCGDFLTYDFQNRYDYALIMGVMDYVENPKEFLAKLGQVVDKKAVLSFPIAESMWTIQRKLRYNIRGCPLYFYRRKEVGELIEYSAFKSYSIERIARDYLVVAER